MPPKKKTSSTKTTPIESLKHNDKRANIPTEELRDFVAEDEKSPKIVLYPRDPSLDPQLVWKGKDEQDSVDLAVPAVPIYIQEKIHPRAIIENVRGQAKKKEPVEQLALFDDFNGIDFEELIDFYKHEQNWSNRMILGDSLMVMTSLAEKEGLKGKVQMIYIDPPYGIKFGSNWQVSTRKRDVKDGKAEDTTRQPEQIKAFRDTWQLGIHSYLAYLRDRLIVARELLTESGSIFVQIGDENVHLVRSVMDEVFGSENFCSMIVFTKTGSLVSDELSNVSDYLLLYAKNGEEQECRSPLATKEELGISDSYSWLELPDLTRRGLYATEKRDRNEVPINARYYQPTSLISSGTAGGEGSSSFTFEGKEYRVPSNSHWKTTIEGLRKLAITNRIASTTNSLRYIRYLDDYPVSPISNIWTGLGAGSFTEEQVYVVQTSIKVVQRCLLMTTDPGDLVIDPTCGSGTTAYVAEQWGRRWITIDTSRVSIALARTRLMSARYPYYVLADSPEGQKLNVESMQQNEARPEFGAAAASAFDIKKGFIYKRVPHITLKSIANNEEIDVIHAK